MLEGWAMPDPDTVGQMRFPLRSNALPHTLEGVQVRRSRLAARLERSGPWPYVLGEPEW